jgi:hypothetical protein
VNQKNNFSCNICNKNYASKSSLCNHNKKFHNTKNIENVSKYMHNISKNMHNVSKINENNEKKNCKFCNKEFSSTQNRWKHENRSCKQKNKLIIIDKNEFDNIKKELQEIKNKLKNRNIIINTNNTNNTNNTTNNINNGTIINNTFVKFPQVFYNKLLNNKQIMHILNQQCVSLETSVKMINLNDKYPEYQNIYITNLRDNNAHIFDGKEFITVNRKYALSSLIDSHIYEITEAFNKYGCKLTENSQKIVKDFLNNIIDESTKYTDYNNIKYNNYKAYKMETLTKEIYNKTDKNKLSKIKNQELHEKILSSDESDDDSTC